MFEDYFCGTLVCPPLPPRPFTPAGVKGSLNSQFGYCFLDTGLGERGRGASLGAPKGERGSSSQWLGAWCRGRLGSKGIGVGPGPGPGLGLGASASVRAHARSAARCVQGERSERAHAVPQAIGRAEQRSGARIRAGACLSEASLRPTPRAASSARQPVGPRPLARLFFGYFLLAKQKKVTRPIGRNRYSKPRPTNRNMTSKT